MAWYYWVLIYALIIVIVYFIQEKFIFKPEKLKQDFVFKYDTPFEEYFFDVEPGVRINGLHFFVPKPLGLVIYFHGNTRSIKGWSKYAKDFLKFNYDVLLIDYRGFGKSTGKRSEQAMLNDMQFVYNTLKQRFHEDHLIIYGRSIGSGFATKLACDNNPRYLILDAPYFSFKHVVKRFLPFLPVRFVLRYHLRTDLWIEQVRCHTYIIHGTKDWLIPFTQSEKLRDINKRKITLIAIEGGGHNNLPNFPDYHNFLRDILKY
jgi:uncharacterized protein